MVRLIDQDGAAKWLEAAVSKRGANELWISSPFVTARGLELVERFLARSKARSVLVLTSVEPLQVALGALDALALAACLERHDGRIEARDVRRLHAKVFLLVGKTAMVGSSNLTAGGLDRNHELGYETNNSRDLTELQERLGRWREASHRVSAAELRAVADLADKRFGAIARILRSEPAAPPAFPADVETYFEFVIDVLGRLPKGGVSEERLLGLLASRRASLRSDSDGPLRRMLFLQRVGLVEADGGTIRTSHLAQRVQGAGGKATLASAMQDAYPVLRSLVEVAASRPGPWSQGQMRAELLRIEDWELSQSFEPCLRWAVALGLLHVTERGGSDKQIRKFEAPSVHGPTSSLRAARKRAARRP